MGAARRTGPRRAPAPLPVVAALACAVLTGCGSTVAAKDVPAGMTGDGWFVRRMSA
jgi:Zn-dependent alcohol dehydrogenase